MSEVGQASGSGPVGVPRARGRLPTAETQVGSGYGSGVVLHLSQCDGDSGWACVPTSPRQREDIVSVNPGPWMSGGGARP